MTGMMSTDARLVYMANQIARNFQATGHDAAAASTADHIASFWAPGMRARIHVLAASIDHGLSPIAFAALERLRQQGAPPHQTRATEFAGPDGSDPDDAG